MGVKTHRLLDRLNSFLCPSRKSKDESQVHVAIGAVRIESNSAFRFGNGIVMLLLEQINLTQYAMSRRQRIIQGNGLLRQLIGLPKTLGVRIPLRLPIDKVGQTYVRIRCRVLWIQLDSV